jgi:FKBP-type peptidyl-prolyl cis-trans isomerase FkpA
VIRRRSSVAVLFLIVAAACSSSSPTAPTPPTSSGPYSQIDLVEGTGTQATTGDRVTVAYTGWLYDLSRPDGKGTQFDSGASFTFTIGTGVIRGWSRGVDGMRVGGQRRLVIPPELAYGSSSPGPAIPPNATLVFDITLLSVP